MFDLKANVAANTVAYLLIDIVDLVVLLCHVSFKLFSTLVSFAAEVSCVERVMN